MPIRALLDGNDIIPPLAAREWETLQKRVRTREIELLLPNCKSKAYPRTSPCGVQHFVHYDNDGCEPESELHLLAKMEIVMACRELGYQAIPEFAGEGWRADVLIRSPKWECCFEVQVSPQSFQETLRRQEVYKKHGMRCCWLFLKVPERKALTHNQLPFLSEYATPMFHLQDQPRLAVAVNGKQRPLRQFAHDILKKKLRYSRSKAVEPVTALAQLWRTSCSGCGHIMHFFNVAELRGRAECGAEIYLGQNHSSLLYPESHNAFLNFYMRGIPPEVCEFLRIEKREGLPFYEFTCTGCGQARLAEKPPSSTNLKQLTSLRFSTGPEIEIEIPLNHWCDNPHCAVANTDATGEIQDVLSMSDLRWRCTGINGFRRTMDFKSRLPYRHFRAYSQI